MKAMKTISGTVFALAMAASLMGTVKAEDTRYKVKFDLGNGGSYGCSVQNDASGTYDYKDTITTAPTVTCTGKYYSSGWHESGIEDLVAVAGAEVTKDVVYLPVYRILGNTVDFTVHYVDAKGNTVAPDQTFTGNIGDKVIIPYLYVEGYHPKNAYNISYTLSDDPAKNEFTFVYAKLTGGTIPGPVTYITEDGGITYIVVPADPSGNGGGNNGYWNGGAGQNGKGKNGSTLVDTDTLNPELLIDQDKEQEQAAASGAESKTDEKGTQDIIDNPTPKSNTIGTLAKIGLASGGGILLVLLLLLLTKRFTAEE